MAARNDPATCLHLVLSGAPDALARCRAQAAPGDALWFADDGVRHLLAGEVAPEGCAAVFAAACVAARGLGPAARSRGVELANDDVFARLLRRHPHCLSWT